MKIVAISDTHGEHRSLQLPVGDLLVHTGDLSVAGEQHQIEDFVEWFGSTDFEHKIFIAGNHDSWAEQNSQQLSSLARQCNVSYLNAEQIEIAGFKIWGSPVTPRFMDWSFMLDQGNEIAAHWAAIPADTDILITHGPPFGILDEVETQPLAGTRAGLFRVERAGCPELYRRVQEIAPKLHIFGHIHECYGQSQTASTRYVNASSMNRCYVLDNPPLVLKLQRGTGSVDELAIESCSELAPQCPVVSGMESRTKIQNRSTTGSASAGDTVSKSDSKMRWTID